MAETIGDRLRRIRRDIALTQDQLAASSGISKDLIAMLEQNRRLSARISTLGKLANALGVEMSELLDNRPRLEGGMDASVLAIRDTLLSPSHLPGFDHDDWGEPTPLAELRQNVAAAWLHYWSGQFAELAAMLPGLIGEARHAGSVDAVSAAGVLAQSYQVAACVLTQMGKDELAAISVERAIHAASKGDDELQWATLHGTYSWIMLHEARFDQSEALALRIAEQIEPAISKATPEHLTVWGGLLLTAMAPAAAAGRGAAATEHINVSRAAAVRLEHDRLDYNVNFGPTQVAMQSTHAHATLGEPGKALKAATDVRREELRPISCGAHLIDVALAQTDARRRRDAVSTLVQARQMSPTWFRHQGLARSIVSDLIDAKQQLSPALRGLARELRLDR
jgi:transcriptional regulator with XRE-family HTH domain